MTDQHPDQGASAPVPPAGEVAELARWLRELGAKRGGVFDVSTFCANLDRAAELLERQQPQPDFRALCAELHEALEAKDLTLADDRLLDRSAAALRAALAEPEPVGPTDEEIGEWADACSEAPLEEVQEFGETIRAALARWGNTTPQPVSAEGDVTDDQIEAEFRSWFKDTYGDRYYGAIPLAVLIPWTRHKLALDRSRRAPQAAEETDPIRQAAEQARQALEGWVNHGEWVWPESALEQAKRDTAEALTALNAALAQPVPPRPTDEEIIAFWSDHCAGDGDAGILRLARWGNTTPQPVPVSERMPGPEDCDAEGRCWFSPWHQQGYAPNWRLIEPYLRHFSDAWWLPAHALPIPGDNQ